MVQGFERREVIQDANAKSRETQPASVPLSPVLRPQPSSFSKVGQETRKLAAALEGAGEVFDKYQKKKQGEHQIAGEMARARGVTEEEIMQTGNKYTVRGWQTMNTKVSLDGVRANELDFIKTQGRNMDPAEYQKRLSGILGETADSLPASSSDVRDMLFAGASDMFPELVAQQTRQHNDFNRIQTNDSFRQMTVSTAHTDGPEYAAELMDRNIYGMSQEDYAEAITNALTDSYGLGSDAVEKAVLMSTTGQAKANTPADVKGILDFVGKYESQGNYNAILGGEQQDLTRMTINQVYELQADMVGPQNKESSAVGKYQIINDTLKGLQKNLKLTGDEIFDESMQDYLATALLKEKGIDGFLSNPNADPLEFQDKLAEVWASIPNRTGKSQYAGVGSNKALVDSGSVLRVLTDSRSELGLHGSLSELGLRSDEINKVARARDAYRQEQSNKFDASRLASEKQLVNDSIFLSDEDLIKQITDTKEAAGYSDAWANKVWASSMSARKADKKEREKVTKVNDMIQSGTIKTGSKKEQQDAIDMVTARALSNNPDAQDAQSPNSQQARAAAQQEVFQFMYDNQITDDRLKAQWDVATLGDIVDGNGRIKPNALQAYNGYLQAKQSTNDPMFAQKLLSERTKDLFLMADSYRGTEDQADAEQALITASAFVQEQEATQNQLALPWWKDKNLSVGVEMKLKDETLPGILRAFGLGRTEAQMRWEINDDSVEKAIDSSNVLGRIKSEAAKNWQSKKHWSDQDAARDLSLAKAANKVMDNMEYVAGSFVYTGDQPSIAERIGMGGIKNAANMVTSRIMAELGPEIWKDYNETDIYSMSQSWYAKSPGVGKAVDWVASAAGQTIGSPIDTIGNVLSKGGEKMRGVPDFAATLNPSGNAIVLSPYTNYDRTAQGAPYILSVEKMKEAARFLNDGDEEGFQSWIEQQKAIVPRY